MRIPNGLFLFFLLSAFAVAADSTAVTAIPENPLKPAAPVSDSGGRKSIILDELKVLGFVDNPDPIYILDMDNSDLRPIRVDRTFVFDPVFKQNVNKEMFEWENEIYYLKNVPFRPEAVKPTADLPARDGRNTKGSP